MSNPWVFCRMRLAREPSRNWINALQPFRIHVHLYKPNALKISRRVSSLHVGLRCRMGMGLRMLMFHPMYS